MPKQKQDVSLNQLVKGIITEANPLNYPPGSSIDEKNFVFNNNGTRRRRLGMDKELGGITNPVPGGSSEGAYNSFKWENINNDATLTVMVFQVGNQLLFHGIEDGISISSNFLGSLIVGSDTNQVYDFVSVDGLLLVATGEASLYTVGYNGVAFTITERFRLEVRDFFGLRDFDKGYSNEGATNGLIDRGNGVSYRPPATQDDPFVPPTPDPDHGLSDVHKYNLFNQGWPDEPVWCFTDGDKKEKKLEYPLIYLQDWAWINYPPLGDNPDTWPGAFWPSNADSYNLFVVSDATEKPSTADGFSPADMLQYVPNFESPRGKFIIDLMSRGQSRRKVTGINSLPLDQSSGGVKTLAEYAGRVFYAGFEGALLDGDEKSPKLGSYVAFSQNIEYTAQLKQCYQVGDPTAKDDSAIVATDGGLIRISEAKNVTHLESMGESVLVFAENGVWQIIGSDEIGFTATGFQVVKVSERGCTSPRSVINIGSAVMYWALDGIYLVQPSGDNGVAIAENITVGTIRTAYSEIDNKNEVFGQYDEFERTARWIYEDNQELVYKIDFKAFTKNDLYYGVDTPKIVGMVESPPFAKGEYFDVITVPQNDVVTVNGEDVGITISARLNQKVNVKYFVIQGDSYTLADYNNQVFVDWHKMTNTLNDAAGYLEAAYFTGGLSSKEKQSPYITFHFVKSETGYYDNFDPINPSSCIVQSKWDWSNSANANKWGRPFQAYRFRRHYIPEDTFDEFDNGYTTVVTKNKMRGKGKALSLRLSTEPFKDCHLIGWEQEITANTM